MKSIIVCVCLSSLALGDVLFPDINRHEPAGVMSQTNMNYLGSTMLVQQHSVCHTKNDCERGKEGYTQCVHGKCQHKDLWPLKPSEWVGFCLLGFILGFANFAGVNGSCLVVPIMIFFFEFGTTQTIALSNMASFIGSLTRYFLFSIRQKHPNNKDKTVIDHNISSVIIPMILIGSYIGVFINLLMPPAIVGSALSGFMIYLAILTIQKGYKLWKAESESEGERIKSALKEEIEEEKPLMADEKCRISNGGTPNTTDTPSTKDAFTSQPSDDRSAILSMDSLIGSIEKATFDEAESLELDQIVENEKTECGQWSSQLMNWFLMGFFLFISLARGTPAVNSIFGATACGDMYWGFVACFLIVVGFCNYACIRKSRRTQMLKTKYNRGFASENDVRLTDVVLWKVLCGSLLSGLVGAQGLGGAETVSAVLLGIEMPPLVSSTTTQYTTMFGNGALATLYFIEGDLLPSYAIVLALLSSAFTILSMSILESVLKKYNRTSVIVFALAAAITLASIVLPIQLVLNIQDATKHGHNWDSLGNICKVPASH